MKNFAEILDESFVLVEGMDEAKAIRTILKDKLKLTSRDVSVTNKGAINVTIKTIKALPHMETIKKIASNYESYSRDERSQEILSGGNTFVFVELDWTFRTKLVKQIYKEIESSVTPEWLEGKTKSNALPLKKFGNRYEVVKYTHGKFAAHDTKRNYSGGGELWKLEDAAGKILSMMIEIGDEKNLKKLG